MIKIGLYLENKNISDVDLSKPEQGNPGIGGTEFLFVAMPYYFEKYLDKNVKFIWYANETDNLPNNIQSNKAKTREDAIKKAEKNNCDIFIWRPTIYLEEKEFLNKVKEFNLKLIAWAHNTPDFRVLNLINDCKKVKRLVCVSKEQLDSLRDHNVFYKSTYVYNAINPKIYKPKNTKSNNYIVTFLGSIVPTKGFHELARVWPKVKEKVPRAKLVVLGSGKLYNRSQNLGEWNIAEENYEKIWRKYLADDQGNIIDSVIFKGFVGGSEKIYFLQESQVGVVNPSGASETFCLSAIEFQASGTPVVTGANKALLDTVSHNKTGLLGKNDSDLVNNITKLLLDKSFANKLGENGIEFVEENFSFKTIVKDWHQLFENVYDDKANKIKNIEQNYFNDYKFLREIWRNLKKYIPGMNKAPSFSEMKNKFKSLR